MIQLAALALVILLSSCSTIQTSSQRGNESIETASVLPVPATRGASEDSGVVIAYDFQGAKGIGEGGCRLRLLEVKTRKSTFLNVKPETGAAFAPVKPGRYETGRMGCGITKVWDLANILPGVIEVQAGSASYVGKVVFMFNGKELSEVRKPSRAEHASGFQAALNVIPNGLPMVSAYSLVPLSAEMASEGTAAQGFDVKAQGVPSGAALDGLLANLQKCETQSDPLRFGRLDYKASYKDGRFADFKERRDANAFSEGFKSCVAETLSAFRPPAKGAVEIQVVY